MTAKIKLNSASGGGSFSIQAPSSSSNNRVFTLPDSADATILTSLSSVGKIVDQKFALSTTNEQNTSANTTWTLVGPQITHTAASTSNKLVFLHSHHLMIEGAMFWHMGFYRDGISGTQVGQIKTYTQLASNWSACTGITNFVTTAPDTSSHTYQFAIYRNGGSDALIRYSPNSESFGASIMMFEVEP
tara:strand:- start:400 stop:963 length:564 start_codon:yes stop_codon:yes gene_type:complete